MTTRFVGRVPQVHKCEPGGFWTPWVGDGAPLNSTPENPVYRWRSRYTPWAPKGTVEQCQECGQYWEAVASKYANVLSTEWERVDRGRLRLLREMGVIEWPERPPNPSRPDETGDTGRWFALLLLIVAVAVVVALFVLTVH